MESAETVRRDFKYRVRQAVGPWIDRLARTFGESSYHIRHTEYAGTVHLPIQELEARLAGGGFTWDPVSLYHRTPMGTNTDGSWAYRPRPFSDRQVHAVLFAQSADRVDVYAHNEYNWLRHPVKHANQVDVRREKGAAQFRRWLDAQSLDYDRESIVSRKAVHLVELVRERLAGRAPRDRGSVASLFD